MTMMLGFLRFFGCCPHDFMKTTHGAVDDDQQFDDDNDDYDVI